MPILWPLEGAFWWGHGFWYNQYALLTLSSVVRCLLMGSACLVTGMPNKAFSNIGHFTNARTGPSWFHKINWHFYNSECGASCNSQICNSTLISKLRSHPSPSVQIHWAYSTSPITSSFKLSLAMWTLWKRLDQSLTSEHKKCKMFKNGDPVAAPVTGIFIGTKFLARSQYINHLWLGDYHRT